VHRARNAAEARVRRRHGAVPPGRCAAPWLPGALAEHGIPAHDPPESGVWVEVPSLVPSWLLSLVPSLVPSVLPSLLLLLLVPLLSLPLLLVLLLVLLALLGLAVLAVLVWGSERGCRMSLQVWSRMQGVPAVAHGPCVVRNSMAQPCPILVVCAPCVCWRCLP
jgi:hypothetical protein